MSETRARYRVTPKARRGRASIFRGKLKAGTRVQGILSPAGAESFEAARVRLARLAAREVTAVSDADVIEYLARGERATRAALAPQG